MSGSSRGQSSAKLVLIHAGAGYPAPATKLPQQQQRGFGRFQYPRCRASHNELPDP